MATKKVKQFAKYGARYGVGIRKRLLKIEPLQRKKHKCPLCGFEKASRISTGIFRCSKCNHKFAGGAYLPETNAGRTIKKMVEQKSFMPNVVELLKEKEHIENPEESPEMDNKNRRKKKKAGSLEKSAEAEESKESFEAEEGED